MVPIQSLWPEVRHHHQVYMQTKATKLALRLYKDRPNAAAYETKIVFCLTTCIPRSRLSLVRITTTTIARKLS